MSSTHKLPSSPHEWQDLAKRNGLIGSTIHTAHLNSASMIEEDQYLLFRVLWKIHPIQQFDWKQTPFRNQHLHWLIISSFRPQALETKHGHLMLQSLLFHIVLAARRQSWKELKEELDDTESPLAPISPGPEEIQNLIYRQTKDEQIVNTALINFLSALTLNAGLPDHWTLHRKSYKAYFTHASFEACTDGYLEDTKPGGKVRALIEVKAVPRERKRQMICMQEAAQMVVWILSHSDRGGWLNLLDGKSSELLAFNIYAK
ncbi:hypothetical protein ACJ73_06943 [Blastomyces percursus]|uniref:Uncharacterized protein n=1 Tax=Blastomyces percursus TaxID=1658174 RepID=A0A1J9QZS6_9EURO|nr:hypothetical protein ACJ73_06943 [Blastomyces percursus]